VLAKQTSRSVQSVELVLTDIRHDVKLTRSKTPEEFRSLRAGKDTFSYLVEFSKRLPEADVITVADEYGKVINPSRVACACCTSVRSGFFGQPRLVNQRARGEPRQRTNSCTDIIAIIGERRWDRHRPFGRGQDHERAVS
jgi:hypothetical protein